MEEKDKTLLIERIKEQSQYVKSFSQNIINDLIEVYSVDFTKIKYSKTIKDPKKIALDFYKYYNHKYYEIILDGLRSGKIIISEKNNGSYTDPIDKKSYIKLMNNDGDIFLLVHEFAHYIDLNSNPLIIPSEYNCFCEVYSFYYEKLFSKFLNSKKYHEVIKARENNRIFSEMKMVKAIKYEQFYEKKFKENGTLSFTEVDKDAIEYLIKYKEENNLINTFLRYPIGNILSEYLINNMEINDDYDIFNKCLSFDYSSFKSVAKNLIKKCM